MARHTRESRLTFSFLLSLFIHAGVILFLIYGAWQTVKALNVGQKGQTIEATMVDKTVVNHYLAQQSNQQKRLESVQQQQQEKEIEYQKALQAAKQKEQQRLKELEKERQQAQLESKKRAEAKQAEEEAIKALSKQKEQAELEKQKLLKQQKQAELEAEKARVEAKKLKDKLEAEKKAAEALKQKEKAQKEQQNKNNQTVDSLLEDILANENENTSAQLQGEIDTTEYAALATKAIQSRFFNPGEIYRGKSCELKIKIDENGIILSLAAVGGDTNLCNEAIKAARSAKLPKPTAQEYAKVKNLTLNFEPH